MRGSDDSVVVRLSLARGPDDLVSVGLFLARVVDGLAEGERRRRGRRTLSRAALVGNTLFTSLVSICNLV